MKAGLSKTEKQNSYQFVRTDHQKYWQLNGVYNNDYILLNK